MVNESGVKKVSVKMVTHDTFNKSMLLKNANVINISEYREDGIKHDDFMSGYTFEFLIDSVVMFGNGLWMAGKGLVGMSSWALVTLWEGIKYLFKFAFGKKKEEKK